MINGTGVGIGTGMYLVRDRTEYGCQTDRKLSAMISARMAQCPKQF